MHNTYKLITQVQTAVGAKISLSVKIALETGLAIVEWQPPQPNRRFADLPRQYPTQTKGYSSFTAARADGWVSINTSKTIEHYHGHAIRCVDVTPPPSFGYELAIECAGIRYLESQTVWAEDGHVAKFCPMFRAGDLVDAIEAARARVGNGNGNG